MTPEALEQLLDRDAFDRYLRSLAPEAPIGNARDCNDCPLARWLKACGAPDNVEVSEDTLTATLPHAGDGEIKQSFGLPEWATAFVMGIDSIPGHDMRVAEQGVRLMNSLDITIAAMREEPQDGDPDEDSGADGSYYDR